MASVQISKSLDYIQSSNYFYLTPENTINSTIRINDLFSNYKTSNNIDQSIYAFRLKNVHIKVNFDNIYQFQYGSIVKINLTLKNGTEILLEESQSVGERVENSLKIDSVYYFEKINNFFPTLFDYSNLKIEISFSSSNNSNCYISYSYNVIFNTELQREIEVYIKGQHRFSCLLDTGISSLYPTSLAIVENLYSSCYNIKGWDINSSASTIVYPQKPSSYSFPSNHYIIYAVVEQCGIVTIRDDFTGWESKNYYWAEEIGQNRSFSNPYDESGRFEDVRQQSIDYLRYYDFLGWRRSNASVEDVSLNSNDLTTNVIYGNTAQLGTEIIYSSVYRKKCIVRFYLFPEDEDYYYSDTQNPTYSYGQILPESKIPEGTPTSTFGVFQGWTRFPSQIDYSTLTDAQKEELYGDKIITAYDPNCPVALDKSGNYFEFKIYACWNPYRTINFYSTITGEILKTETIENGETLNFNYSPSSVKTTKYNHEGWYDGTGQNLVPTNPGLTIKGPDAVYQSNTTNFYDISDSITVTSDINLYSIQQSKYRVVFHKYPHQLNGSDNIYSQTTNSLKIKGEDLQYFPNPGSNVTRTNYVFKGWTYNDTYTIYNESYNIPEFCTAGDSPNLTNKLINVAQETTDYFDIHFYPVWNEKIHIIYQDPLHNLTTTNSYHVEKGTDYTLKATDYGNNINNYITNNSANEKGYNFVGWVLENKNDNLCTPYIETGDSYLYYPDTTITSSNFNSNKTNLYIRNLLSYTSASTTSYNSSLIYYRRLIIYRSSDTIESNNTNLTLYAVWQRKYRTRYYITDSSSMTSFQEKLTYQGSTNIATPTSNLPQKTGYVFKGWTIYNDSNHTDYTKYQNFSIDEGFYESKLNGISVDDAIIDQATTTRSGGASGYFYINFYPVWNPKVNVIYYDTLHNLSNSNSTLVERGYDYTLNSDHYGSSINNYITDNSANEKGYNFIGWVLQNKDEQNQDLILYGPIIDDNYLYYQDTSITASNFNSKKATLYTENNHIYSSAKDSTFIAGTKYYKRIIIYTNGSEVEELWTDLSLYAVWRRKYKTRYYLDYPGSATLTSTQEGLIYDGADIKTPASNPSKTGYVFKGWTIYTDNNHLDYSTYYNPSSINGFYDPNSNIGQIDDAIINQATTTRSGGASGYFYINFYPVWNPCYTLTFISSYPNIVGGEKEKINNLIAERGEDFTVTSTHFPSNINNNGYELQGWTERSPSDPNVVGKSAAIKNTWYEKVSFTSGNEAAEFEEKKFLLYTKSGTVYTKITKNVNPSTLSYSSKTDYYVKYTDLDPLGDVIEGGKIYKNLTYYAIWKKKYQIIFRNANGENITTQFKFENEYVTEVNSNDLPKTNITAPIVTYSDPTSSGSGNYGFIYDTESQEYVSQNKGQSNSYALGRFSFVATTKCGLVITAKNYSEKNYDYGIFSYLNQNLSASKNADTSTTIVKMKGYKTSNTYKIYYEIPAAGTYYFDAKYIKDSVGNVGNDELRFSIEFVNLNKDFQGWTRNSSDTIYENINMSNFFAPGEIPQVKDEQVNNTILGDAFQIIYYPVWSFKYSIFLMNPDLNQGIGCLNEISYGDSKTIKTTDFNSNVDSFTANGYTLEGWSTSEKVGPLVAQDSLDYDLTDTINNIVSDITLYLILKNKYSLQFYNINKTSILNTVRDYEINENPSLPNNPSNTNYKFIGWVLNNNYLNHYYLLTPEEKSLIYLEDNPIKKITHEDASRNNTSGYFVISYYSVWDKKYNIIFKDTLHNLTSNNNYIVDYDKDIDFTDLNKPTSVVDNGYQLLGWRKSITPEIIYTELPDSNNTNYGFEIVNSKNHIWKSKHNYAMNRYSLGRFSFTVPKACTLYITAQNDSNENYHYGIFSNLNTQLNNSNTVDTENVKMTGKGTRQEYIITYEIPAQGTYSFDVKYIHCNSSYFTYCDNLVFNISFDIEPDQYIGPDSILLDSDYNEEQNSIKTIDSDIFLYSIYKKKYRVLFMNDSNEILRTFTTNSNTFEPFYNNDDNLDLPNLQPTKTSYAFKGWTDSSSAIARNYQTRITNNFYDETFNIKDICAYPKTRTDYITYFDIKFYPVWNRVYTITFKDTISSKEKSHTIEAGENFNFSDYTLINLSEDTNAYTRLGWTLRDYTNNDQKDTICGPSAYKDNTTDFDNENSIIPTSLIINDLILYAIQKKKYTLRFFNRNKKVFETYEDYYLNDTVSIFPEIEYYNNAFKGWTLDSAAMIYNPNNNNIIYDSTEGLPNIIDSQASDLTNGYFYIDYYPVFNSLYRIRYFDIDEYSKRWVELISIEEVEAGTIHPILNNDYENKLKYEILGWNTEKIFPTSTTPEHQLVGDSITIDSDIDFYLACKKRYALKIQDKNIYNDENSAINIDQGNAAYDFDEDIYYYNYGQNLNIIMTPKENECFISKEYNNDPNSTNLSCGESNRTLIFTLELNESTYNTSNEPYNILQYSLGKGVKFIPIIRLENKQHDEEYYNTNFYVNNIALEDYENNYAVFQDYIQKTIPSQKEYYYLGDTITYTFEHSLSRPPYVQYYIKEISFSENDTWFEEEEPINKTRAEIQNGFSNNYATYTYTHTITLDDIEEDGKTIKIIPYYTPYNNIIHIDNTSYIELAYPQENNQYTFNLTSGTINVKYSTGYFYVFNDQSENCYVTIAPYNLNGFIPTSFTYKDPSMESNETISIYDFLEQKKLGQNWKNFYYNNKYTLNTIGIKLTPEDTSTYHEDLYELKMNGSIGYLQKVSIISKPISKLEINKSEQTVDGSIEENNMVFYINSALLSENNTTYIIQDQKDSGLSFKEFKLDTASTYNIITKSDIVDNNISLPSGWTRTESKDHTDTITYTNNNLSARNGYIDYVTITFDESLPLFYVDQKALQLYWENTKAEGLYWENIRLL